MEGKQKISPRASPSFKHLPKGLDDNELLKIACEFKLGNFENKDKFILAYIRLATYEARRAAKYEGILDDLISVALITLSNVPYEVKDRMYNLNIIGYLRSRIRTRCTEFCRNDFVFYTPKDSKYKRIKRKNIELEEIVQNNSYHSEVVQRLDEQIQQCIITALDRIVYNYRKKGYNDTEIAAILGCHQSKISRVRQTLELRFNELRKHE